LGSKLLKAFIKRNFEIVLLKRLASNCSRIKDCVYNEKVFVYNIEEVQIKSIFEQHDVDIVVHCATNHGRDDDIVNVERCNVVFPLAILQEIGSSKSFKSKIFINADTALSKKTSAYSLSKKQFCEWLNFSAIQSVNLRLSNFYGADYDLNNFTTFVIRSMLNNVSKLDLTLGEQKRRFIYIDDVVNAFLTLIGNKDRIQDKFTSIDVSVEESTSIKDFVLKVKEFTKNTTTVLNFGKIPYRINESMDLVLDNIKTLYDLGWSPKFSLDDGLQLTVKQEKMIK
jgi:nucleoside-diphosphate-sugar epimerase